MDQFQQRPRKDAGAHDDEVDATAKSLELIERSANADRARCAERLDWFVRGIKQILI